MEIFERKWDCAVCGSLVLYINGAIRCNCGSVYPNKMERSDLRNFRRVVYKNIDVESEDH